MRNLHEGVSSIMDLLPIGSVVVLNGGTKKLMVTGVKQKAVDTDKEYDYISVYYPEGHLGDDSSFLFNHQDIRDVAFIGYESEEREEFVALIEEAYEKLIGR